MHKNRFMKMASDISLNILRNQAHKIAVAHGFHNEEKPDEHYLMMVITETAEAIDADRKGRHANIARFDSEISETTSDEKFRELYTLCIKGTLEDELSDIAIRLLDFYGLKGVNLANIPLVSDEVAQAVRNKPITLFMYGLISSIMDMPQSPAPFTDLYTYAYTLGINLYKFIQIKMRYNNMRPLRNGCLY